MSSTTENSDVTKNTYFSLVCYLKTQWVLNVLKHKGFDFVYLVIVS